MAGKTEYCTGQEKKKEKGSPNPVPSHREKEKKGIQGV